MVKAQLILALAAFATLASASTYAVTWEFPSELNLADDKYPPLTVALGDTVELTWTGNHGVYLLAMGTGVECPASFPSGPAVLAPASMGGSFVWTPAHTGIYNLACQVGDHCSEDHMLLEVIVTSGPAPAPGPSYRRLAPSVAPSASAS